MTIAQEKLEEAMEEIAEEEGWIKEDVDSDPPCTVDSQNFMGKLVNQSRRSV